ncbi:hypothetical protein Fot_03719 [Forsythia ovata]|uniref:Uncharacterized protein n=1 Tax=Forsythia ovata TaxID=205694 RepID=A0ABD1XEH7_9LAMI
MSVSAIVPLMPEVAIDVSSTVPLMPEATLDISSALFPEEPILPLENIRRSNKWKRVINGEGEKDLLKMGMEDKDSMRNSWKAKRGRETPLQRVGEDTPHL